MTNTNEFAANAQSSEAAAGHPFAPLMARVRAFGLDRELANGASSASTPAHTARARYLTSDRTRQHVAKDLDALMERAAPEHQRRLALSGAIQPARKSVRIAEPQLMRLSERLRTDESIEPRGMAALRTLLVDGAGPLYNDGNPDQLKLQLENIDAWMSHSSN